MLRIPRPEAGFRGFFLQTEFSFSMNPGGHNPGSSNLILWTFLVYFLIAIVMLGWLLWPFLATIVMAAVVTAAFNPVYLYLAQKMPKVAASLVTCVLIFIVLFVPTVLLVGALTTQAYDLYLSARSAALPEKITQLLRGSTLLEELNARLAGYNITIGAEEINRAVAELGKTVGLFLYEQARTITANVLSFLVNFFFMLLIGFYLFVDQQRLLSYILELSPLPEEQDRVLIRKFKDMTGAILIGNGLSGLIQGFLGGVVFAFLGLPSPILWGVIMTLLAFLPIVGIGVVMLPAAVLLLLKGRIVAGIFIVVFYALLSGSIEYFFKPRMVGKRVRMHTLLVFFSIIGGLQMFGILGIIFGPLIVTGFLTLTEIYHASYRNLVDSVKT
jgi:predicted PurR-regulated permease PerM